MKPETLLAQAGSRWDTRTGAISMPIYQVATFRHPGLGQSTGFDYSRTSNPTRLVLEETLAQVEGGHQAFAFASGLAAIDCLLRLFAPGDRLLVTEDLYGGTFRLLEKAGRAMGIDTVYVDTSRGGEVERHLDDRVRGLLIESPTNPLLRIADIRALTRLAREHGILTVVDNTFLTPWLQRPLELGADISVYSASKYLGGHDDVVAGVLVARSPAHAERLAFFQNAVGAVLGPHDAWLLLRGLKTLPLRLERQQANARRVAAWLTTHPRVTRVHYPGLPGHAGHDTLRSQAGGFGAMIAFEVDDAARIPHILASVKVFLFAESLGGVESLVTYPAVQTHADVPPEIRARLGIHDRLLRLSIGVEDVTDLIGDLEAVLA